MELLRAEGLSFRYGAADTLLDVSLGLNAGQKLGLVGPNGAGKSTLLRLLADELKPEEGRVLRAPGLRVGVLRREFEPGRTLWEASEGALKHVRSLERALREEEARLSAGEDRLAAYGELVEAFEAAGGYHAEEGLRSFLAAFGFNEAHYNREVSTLSGGEGARLALAVLLAEGADVLLLDEPSNGLDLTTRRGLAQRLAEIKSAFVLASHDRALLDAACTHTAWLEQDRLSLYRGGYSGALEQRGQKLRSREKRNRERDKERARLAQTRAGMAGWNTPAAARGRKAVEARVKRLEGEVEPSSSAKPAELRLETERARGTLLAAEHLSKSYGGQAVVRDASLRVHAGDKLALVGPNGSGKSTLLELLVGELESDNPKSRLDWGKDAKVAVFDQQNRGLSDNLDLLDGLTRYVSEGRARGLLSLVGFRGEDVGKVPAELSEGQKARAGLALLMAVEANLLILDEPGEGLDVAMIGLLEGALRDTEAAFVLVSHDETLIEGVAERVLTLQGGVLKEFRGGLAGYYGGTLRLEEVREKEREPEPEESLEEREERLEAERLELDERLLDPFGLSEREVERLKRRYREVTDALFALYDARLPPPGPRYGVREGAVEVWGDEAGGAVLFRSNAGLAVTLILPTLEAGDGEAKQEGRVGHLVLAEPEDKCPLPWARERVLNAVARIAFERLGVRALQLQTSHDLSGSHFRAAGEDWWTLSRAAYEAAEGYGRRQSRRARRLLLHPSWPDWAARRRERKRRSE